MSISNSELWRDWVIRKEMRPAWLVLVVSLAATIIFWHFAQGLEREAQQTRLSALSTAFTSEIDRRMTAYRQMLRASAGLFATSLDVNRTDWQLFVSKLDIEGLYPGTAGLGFSLMIAPEALAGHEVAYRELYRNDYEVHPAGKRDAYSAIVMLEPDNFQNRRAIGFDMYSEQRRRTAMDAAVSTGQVTLSREVTLLQETDAGQQAGVLLYFPVFKSAVPPTSVADRQKQLKGFVYAPIRVGAFMSDVVKKLFAESSDLIRLEVFDSAKPDENSFLYDSSTPDAKIRAHSLFTIVSNYTLNGTDWTVRATSLPAFENMIVSRNPDLILGLGLLSTMLLWALALSMAARRIEDAEAKTQSAMLTRELSHRVRNTLAIVQSVANRSLTNDRTIREGRDVFLKRLHALARAHTFLLNNAWRGADITEVIAAELAVFENRAAIRGPSIFISPHLTQSLSLIVHELAMNAIKFGAFSNDTGQVAVNWVVQHDPDNVLHMTWTETGGPAVSSPSRHGFGQVLLQKTIGSGATKAPIIEYRPEGLYYEVEFRLDQDVPAGSTAAPSYGSEAG